MKKPLILFLISVTLFLGCSSNNNDDDSPDVVVALPSLTSTTVSSITQISAESGGNITNDGGATVTARGVCWSTTTNPTIADDKTIDGSGVGSFISSIIDLTMNTTYYVRAYATNSQGTAYGNEVSFTTSPELVYDGSINLTTQQEVEDFGSNGYNRVTGDVFILGNTITDISSLLDLKNIGDDLLIDDTSLTTLEGLDNLNSIGGYFNIFNNGNLINFEGLTNLTNVESNLRIDNNDVLVDVSALENLTSLGGALSLSNNGVLTNTIGLHNITSIGEGLSVSSCPSLVSLDLDNLEDVALEISTGIQIIGNNSLVNINLSELLTVGDNLTIRNNNNLTNLSKLNKLSYIGRNLLIENNPNLTSMPFESLVTIDRSLNINSNNDLIDLSGLTSLTSVGLDFDLGGNSSNFSSISGLGSLETIGGDAFIVGTLAENLNAFSELTTIGGNFSVSNNSSLENLEGLNKLSSIGGRFWISNNDSLLNLDGLEALVSTGVDTLVGGVGLSLDIVNNNSLLNLNGLSNFVNAKDGAGGLSIYDNDVLDDFCGLDTIITGGAYSIYSVFSNSYNPTEQDIIDGNCSQ